MVNKPDKNVARLRRHRRVRGKISGTAQCPRLDVFRSSKHIYAQLIDDVAGVTWIKILRALAETSRLLQKLARRLLKRLPIRVSPRRSMTVAALFITAA